MDSRFTKGCRKRTPRSCRSSGGFTSLGVLKKMYLCGHTGHQGRVSATSHHLYFVPAETWGCVVPPLTSNRSGHHLPLPRKKTPPTPLDHQCQGLLTRKYSLRSYFESPGLCWVGQEQESPICHLLSPTNLKKPPCSYRVCRMWSHADLGSDSAPSTN